MERQYKDSGIEWIGRIPKEWNTCKLKHVIASMKSGGTPTSSDTSFYNDDGVSWVAIGDMVHCGDIKKTQKHLSEKGLADKQLEVFPIGTLLYSIYASVGKVSVLKIPAAINQAILALSPRQNVSPDYVKFLLVSMEQYVLSLANGNTQFNLNSSIVANLFVPSTSLPEQQRIASYLDKKCGEIDELIALQEKMIAQLTEYKQAVITEAVTKGLDPNAKLVPSGIEWIGDVPEGWKGFAPLKRFTTIILGKMLQSNVTDENDTLEQYICAKDVHFEGVDYSDLKSMYFSKAEKEIYEVHRGDMLVVEGGAGAAGSAIVEKDIEKIYIQNSIMIVREIKDIDIKYVRYVLFSIVSRGYVDYICNKATIPHFTKEKLSGTIIPLPPLAEQHSIASYLDTKCSEIDSLIALKRQKIESLNAYKKSVIYEAVTGKTDIN